MIAETSAATRVVVVTRHAAQRYCERVDQRISLNEAYAAILTHSPAILAAGRFGCRVVRLGCGARLVLSGVTVVTVLPIRRRGFVRALWESPRC